MKRGGKALEAVSRKITSPQVCVPAPRQPGKTRRKPSHLPHASQRRYRCTPLREEIHLHLQTHRKQLKGGAPVSKRILHFRRSGLLGTSLGDWLSGSPCLQHPSVGPRSQTSECLTLSSLGSSALKRCWGNLKRIATTAMEA